MTRTISESKQCRACPPMSSEQLNICNLYFSVNALPKGRCLTEHCVVCVPCRGLCVSPGGRSGLCNHNMYTYILVRIYIYTHICVARQTVLLLLQFANYLGHRVSFDDFVFTYMTICVSYTNTWCKETFVAFVAPAPSRGTILGVPAWIGPAIFSVSRFFYFAEKME